MSKLTCLVFGHYWSGFSSWCKVWYPSFTFTDGTWSRYRECVRCDAVEKETRKAAT